MVKFKVGDVVRCTDPTHDDEHEFNINLGDIGVIHSMIGYHGGNIFVHWFAGGDSWRVMHADQLEKVNAED